MLFRSLQVIDVKDLNLEYADCYTFMKAGVSRFSYI